MSAQSSLNKTFRSLLSGSSSSPQVPTGFSAFGNSSWSAGTPSHIPSYTTLYKPPKASKVVSTAAANSVKSKFGLKDLNKANKKHHSSSLLGDILGGASDIGGNLVDDVISTAENTPAGLLKLATTNPVDSAKAIGHSYAQSYGKLFKGDFGGFAHDVESHPLGYLLDASTLGTGGGALLGRLAPKLAEASTTGLRLSRASAKLGEGQAVSRTLSRNPFTRNVLEKPAYALQRTLPERLPILGEKAAAKRTLANQVESEAGKTLNKLPDVKNALKDIHKQSKKDENLTHAFDAVNAGLRNKSIKIASVFGQNLNPVAKNAEHIAFHETPKTGAEVDALTQKIASEIQYDAKGNIVAKDHAGPETLSFVNLKNAESSLGHSLSKADQPANKIPVMANKTTPATRAVGRKAQTVANQLAPKSGSYLKGVKVVDTHTDPILNYMDTHLNAGKRIAGVNAKAYVEKFTQDPKMVSELTQVYEKHGATSSLTGNLNRATQLWKDAILAARPAFLVNNFVGNQIMYHLKNGTGGISLQKAARGELDGAFNEFFHEHATTLGSAEQAAGTSTYRTNVNKVYNQQSRHEQVLRKGTMREAAMSIPVIKTEVRRLTGQGMSEGKALESAMKKAFKDTNGETYKQLISKAIDDTMGNYRHFNSSEQALRKVVPFYSWNRHALRTYSSILKDQPGTANVLSHLGTMGAAEHEKNFPGTPSFMQTYVTGKYGTYDTQSLNPLKGGSDTIKAIRELVHAKPGNMPTLAGNLNPFISGAGQALSGVNLTTGAPVTGFNAGLVGSIIQQTGENLPQVKLLGQLRGNTNDRNDPHYFLTPTGQLKKKFIDSEGKIKMGPDGKPMEAADRHMLNQSPENTALAIIGIPKRDVNLKTAQTVAKSIETKAKGPGEFHNRKKQKAKVRAIIAHTSKPAKFKPF